MPITTKACLTRGAGLLVPILAWAIDLLLMQKDPGFATNSVLVSAAVFTSLCARHRWPVPVLVLHLLWSAGAWPWLQIVAPLAGSLVALESLAARRSTAVSVGGLAATTCVLFLQLGFLNSISADALAQGIAACLITATAWALGHRRYAAAAAQTAATKDALHAERLRLARDLHDIVTHAISAIIFQAAGARAVIGDDPDRAACALDAIEATSVQAMDELRRLLGLLRSADKDAAPDLNRQPGLQDIGDLLDWARTNGLTPATTVEGEPGQLDEFTSLAAYRLVQEALTNTLKHAGPGTTVDLLLHWDHQHVDIRIQDHPPSRQDHSRSRFTIGHGLQGLHERIAVVGGTLHTYPHDDGFRLEARLPLLRHHNSSSTTLLIAERPTP